MTKKEKIFLVILFIGIVFLHLLLIENIRDDLFFSNIPLENIFPWLQERYLIWTSRIFIDAIVVFLLKCPAIIWCILNTFFLFLLSWSISYLFTKNTYKIKVLVLCCVFFLPLYILKEAGWCATSINYLWPCAAGIFSFIPIKNALIGRKEKNWTYPIYAIALLFGCNQELMALIVTAFYIIMGIYCWKEKKLTKFIIFQCILSLLSIGFILLCPGNEIRAITETANRYPIYESFNLIHKIVLGLLSTFAILLNNIRLPILALALILPFALFKNKNKWIRLNAFIPLLYIFGIKILPDIFPFFKRITNSLTYYLYQPNYIPMASLKTYFWILGAIIFIVSIIISLYSIFGEKNKTTGILFSLIFLAGFCSRIVMGFSSTIYASGERTFLFLYVALVICFAATLIKVLKKSMDKSAVIVGLMILVVQMIQMIIIE